MTAEPPELAVGGTVNLRMRLTNATDRGLMVCVLGTALDYFPGNNYDVIAPDGTKRSYTGMQAARHVSRGDYKRMEPGVTIEGLANLSEGYDFTAPGTYRVTWERWLVDVQPVTTKELPPKRKSPTGLLCPPVSIEVRATTH